MKIDDYMSQIPVKCPVLQCWRILPKSRSRSWWLPKFNVIPYSIPCPQRNFL